MRSRLFLRAGAIHTSPKLRARRPSTGGVVTAAAEVRASRRVLQRVYSSVSCVLCVMA